MFTWKGKQGFTLIEMMVALAVLAILVVFGSPALENSGARSDMKKATDQVAQAFREAKNAARANNSAVTVTLTTNETANSISFLFSNGTDTADSGQTLPTIVLPERVTVETATPEFTFDSLGMVNTTGSIALISAANADFASTVAINTLMGHVTSSYDEHDS